MNYNLKQKVKKELKCLNSNNKVLSKRFYEEKFRKRQQGGYHRDYCRILYSSFFRRLQGKMQFLGINSNNFYRNRLTHSLEVAQIARSIAYMCGYDSNDVFVVEAGALAHDLGNPPFGHYGEHVLNDVFQSIGGFEGNAQTLRILRFLEQKKSDFQGLNLTLRTLLSVVKYYKKFKYGENNKFIYDEDYESISERISKCPVKCRTLDVQIVDIADEIAYAAHDLEDGIGNEIFTIEEILADISSKNKKSYKLFSKIVNEARETLDLKNIDINGDQYSTLFKKELLSLMISKFIEDIHYDNVDFEKKVSTGTEQNKELMFDSYNDLIPQLKKSIYDCATYGDEIYIYEKKGEIVIKTLSDFYLNNIKILPVEYRENYYERFIEHKNNKHLQERLVCDYIAGMMDTFAIKQYEMITGNKFDQIKLS